MIGRAQKVKQNWQRFIGLADDMEREIKADPKWKYMEEPFKEVLAMKHDLYNSLSKFGKEFMIMELKDMRKQFDNDEDGSGKCQVYKNDTCDFSATIKT